MEFVVLELSILNVQEGSVSFETKMIRYLKTSKWDGSEHQVSLYQK